LNEDFENKDQTETIHKDLVGFRLVGAQAKKETAKEVGNVHARLKNSA
jgi:hypothetical protein